MYIYYKNTLIIYKGNFMEKRLFFKMLEDQRKIIEDKKFNGNTSEQLAKDLNNYNAMLKFAYFYSDI